MLRNYFRPKKNTLYGISFLAEHPADRMLLAANSSNEAIFTTSGVPLAHQIDYSSLPNNKLWQFFEIGKNAYVLANYGSGLILNLSDDYSSLVMGTLSSQTPVCTFAYIDKEERRSASMFVNNQDFCAWLYPELDEPNQTFTANFSATFGMPMKIIEAKPNPVHLPKENISNLEYPSFVNNMPPPVFPVTSLLMNTFAIPYIFVNDPSMPNRGDQIKNSPYYILRQYGQYKLSTSLNNPSLDTVTLVEEWQQGWSDTTSSAFSDTIGATLGGSMEGNEIFVKETLSSELNAQLGITQTKTSDQSESQMTQVRIAVPPNTNMAMYGIKTTLELYQTQGVCPIASPNTPMCLDNGFTIISEPSSNV